ncbi:MULTISPECIES: Bpu10I family restriction endonuclease [unclassified Halanaerobium]|uniref:Bpu10I family restriction endonuclease n=1 Tax=unclassified Halanaerobium TaxID=2641197 RepID=UPI000DF13C44|nr:MULTISPECIES: Bpu10I family restriction endonuclease [unclassified Halanaerobium]RCW46655.1 Bpu10I restriction endonuclease [Halanaerobium sp. MA284_MarDTE_T2]RCW83499.1 Bpu10I restriction endonuclease [Halanaerobium sp. DL-01]
MNNWFYHGNNIDTKINKSKPYKGIRQELKDFRKNYYLSFKNNLMSITDINKEAVYSKVELINKYYKIAESFERKHNISSQSKFRSTILEEFMGYLFKDIPEIEGMGLEFNNKNIFAGIKLDHNGNINIQTKDVDFCIGKNFDIYVDAQKNKYEIFIPIVAIECKTYLDKTMYSEAQFSAQKIKNGTPNAKTYIIMETNEVALDKYSPQSPIDELYVLRKETGKNISKEITYTFFKELHEDIRQVNKLNEIILPGKILNPDVG